MFRGDEMNLDLVLDGGGVRGIALVGALSVLEEAGYEFRRVAGISVGAIVGSLVAAGMSTSGLRTAMRDLDCRRFLDRTGARRMPVVGKGLSLLVNKGMYSGRFLTTWLGDHLESLGVRTFGDLRLDDDPSTSLPLGRRYKLVVTALDVSQGRLIRLPWDYPSYGLDPDEQLVVDAVRASASIPFIFEPAVLHHGGGGTSLLVDGGLVSDFPIDLFDRADGRAPRWPTFGLKLWGPPAAAAPRTIGGPVGLARAVLATMKNVYDERSFRGLPLAERTISIDTPQVVGCDFGIDRQAQQALYQAGRRSAARFLASWEWESYVQRQRNHPPVVAAEITRLYPLTA